MTLDVAVTIGVRLVRLVAGVLIGVLTARALGPSGRGAYFVVVTLSALVVQFAQVGLPSSNSFYVARQPDLLGKLLVNSIWAAVVVGGATAIVVALAVTSTGVMEVSPQLVWFVVALAPASLLYLLATNLLVGVQRFGTYNTAEFVANSVVVAAIATALLLGLGVAGVLAAAVLAWTSVAAVMALSLLRETRVELRFDRELFRAGLAYSVKAYLATLFAVLVLRSNVFVLQSVAGPAAVGQFSVASQFADVVGIFPTSVALVLFPRLVRDQPGAWSATVRNCANVGVVVGAACLLLIFFAEPAVHLPFGDEFAPSVPIIVALVPSIFCLALLTVVSQFLAALGLPRRLVVMWLAGVVTVLLFGLFLIPVYGAVGAAMSLSATHFALLLSALVLAIRRR